MLWVTWLVINEQLYIFNKTYLIEELEKVMGMEIGEMGKIIFAAFYLSGFAFVVMFVIYHIKDMYTGDSYYRRNPIAKAVEEMAKKGDDRLTYDSIMSAMSNIDCQASKTAQAEQFKAHFPSDD